MHEDQTPISRDAVHSLLSREPGLTTDQVAARLRLPAEGVPDDLPWLLADGFREADGRWYVRDRPLALQGGPSGAERELVSALECYLSEGPQSLAAIHSWCSRCVEWASPEQVEALVVKHFVKGRDGWRLPTPVERRHRRAVQHETIGDPADLSRAFRTAARQWLTEWNRPATIAELLAGLFPLAPVGEWVRDSADWSGRCATPEQFMQQCPVPGATTPLETASHLLRRTPGVCCYDNETVGLSQWPDDRHLLYYWPQLEKCVRSRDARQLARLCARLEGFSLPADLAARVRAVLSLYRTLTV